MDTLDNYRRIIKEVLIPYTQIPYLLIQKIMDSWLTDEVKQLLSQTCLDISNVIAKKLNNRIKVIKQNMDERALTEYLVDACDVSRGEVSNREFFLI